MIEKKISKLGLAFAIANAVIVIAIAYLDSLGSSRGFGLVAILWMEIPATFIIIPLSSFIGSICKVSSPYIVIPASAVIIGGLQWYGIGWVISRLKQRFFSRPKVKEQFK